MWVLVIFLAAGPQVAIPGFTNLTDCRHLGNLNIEFVNPGAQFECRKSK